MTATTALPADWIIPVVVLETATSGPPLAEALLEGGLTSIELTLRTPAGLDALRLLASRAGLTVGAGSVRTAAQVDQVVDAGARFVVSPGWSDAVVERCRHHGVALLPGVATPTEVMAALDAGTEVLKLFPASVLGGPDGVRAMAAPFPSARFVPTGGVDASNLAAYLSIPAVVAVGGSWMVPAPLIAQGRFDEIRRLTAEAVALVSMVRA